VADRRTDRRTDTWGHNIYCASIASSGKKLKKKLKRKRINISRL